jgi:hypothetical protein
MGKFHLVFIQWGYSMEDNNYKLNIRVDIDYDSDKIAGYSYDLRYSHTDLIYTLDINYKSWGIFSIHPSVPTQKISFKLDLCDENVGDSEEYYFEVELVNVEANPELRNHNSLIDSICPQNMELKLFDIVKNGDTITAKANGTLSFCP